MVFGALNLITAKKARKKERKKKKEANFYSFLTAEQEGGHVRSANLLTMVLLY